MYNKGDYVVKIPEGICQIENVGHADGRIRHIITRDDAMKFIKSIPDISEKDISDEKLREQEYKAAILSGDHVKIVSIIKAIYARKQERIKQGKKITATDDRYFKQAEEVLFSVLTVCTCHTIKKYLSTNFLDKNTLFSTRLMYNNHTYK